MVVRFVSDRSCCCRRIGLPVKTVSSLVENYLTRRSSTIVLDRDAPVRIVRSSSDTPIIAMDRWIPIDKKFLKKRFSFRDHDLRDRFITDLLEYERDHGHRARVTFDDLFVDIEVGTKDIDRITELDKEYAIEADLLYKNICY